MTPAELKQALANFDSTTHYYSHWTKMRYTDGISFLAKTAECYWLIDAIASHQPKLLINPQLQQFQIWKLQVKPNQSALLICLEDEGIEKLTQQIPYTDFPLEEITLYLEDSVLMLPSER